MSISSISYQNNKDSNLVILIHCSELDEQAIISLPCLQDFILGRLISDDHIGQPDLDLSFMQAFRHGVSRQHAALRWQNHQLWIKDLDSRNKTYLNKTPLLSHQLTPIKSGDEIGLSSLTFHVYLRGA